MEIFGGELRSSDLTRNALGGSELMLKRIYEDVPSDLLKNFHVVNSRLESSLKHDLRKIFIAHDLPGDPASDFLSNGGWQVFERLIFVSNWQMQAYQAHYQIPPSRCFVMQNAINPIFAQEKAWGGKIRIGYWSTPHRGLSILVPVFEYLAKKYPQIELDVFSSFALYGWEERDSPYKELFDRCNNHPQINYHGSVSNERIREYAATADIFAYPSIWPETSCLCLIEAMSAGMLCVHSNLAALYETASNWTMMYQYHEDLNEHAKVFHLHLEKAILELIDPSSRGPRTRLKAQREYTNLFYDWQIRKDQWKQLLEQIIETPPTNTILIGK